MRFPLIPAALLGLFAAGLAGPAADKTADPGKRVPWDSSHVIGSPDGPRPYRVVRTFSKLDVVCPIGVAHQPGSDQLLLIQQMKAWSGNGRLLRVKDDPNADKFEVLLTLDGIAYGMAFHPDFAKNGYLYLGDNGPMSGGNKKTRVTRYTMETKPPYRLDPKSAKVVIEWDSDGHNGGDLAFGNDGMLYISSGDGTSDSDTNHTGQDLSKLNAKVLRIDVDHPGAGGRQPPEELLHTEGQPVCWFEGRPAGDVGLRLPQPLAAAHRQADRRPVDRPERAGPVGRGLLGPEGGQLRLERLRGEP